MNKITQKTQWMKAAAVVGVAVLIVVLYLLPGEAPRTGDAELGAAYPGLAANHVFTRITGEKAVETLEKGDGVLFLAFPSCPWCQKLAPIVDEAARSKGVDAVYYLDIQQARQDNDATYQKLVDLLDEYLQTDDAGEPVIYVPDVSIIKAGTVIGRFQQEPADDSVRTPDDYWTKVRRERALSQLQGYMVELPKLGR